jgi:tetratricopeptide (TPR) repeat protein
VISGKVVKLMNKRIVHFQTLVLLLTLVTAVFAQSPSPKREPAKSTSSGAVAEGRPQIDRKKLALADRPNLTLEDVNTVIAIDKRVIVMMAALNIGGYDYEPGGRALSVVRQQMRSDLSGVRPELVQRIRSYFQAHRKGANDAAAVAPYLSLALSMTDPPAFTIDVAADRLPDDVREITDFALILEEFYREAGFSRLLPKYVETYIKVAETYGASAGLALGTVLTYLHTEPVLELPPLYVPRRTEKPKKGVPVERIVIPNRIRQFVILPDLLNATGAANLRIVRDTYYLLLGPTIEPNVEAMRRAFISFVIDPLTERQVREVAAIRGDLRKLMETRGERLDQEYAQRSAYFLLTDSLVRATDARMDVVGLAARRPSSEDDALYDLSLGYDRGAVLVYHFYDQIKAFEPVGVNIRDYFATLLKNIDFTREGARLTEYATRLERVKKLRTEATLAPAPKPTIANADEKLVSQILDADRLMKARSYESARLLLETALRENPNNARVLFGLAEVASKQATSLEDADRVEEALFAAIEYYRQAVKNASPPTEQWLAQRSYVAAGRILDFIAENNPALAERLAADAVAAYEAALRIGKVEGGAFEEAEKALRDRTSKPKE